MLGSFFYVIVERVVLVLACPGVCSGVQGSAKSRGFFREDPGVDAGVEGVVGGIN